MIILCACRGVLRWRSPGATGYCGDFSSGRTSPTTRTHSQPSSQRACSCPSSSLYALEDILRRRDRKGKLTFPHLQTALTTRWGCYAWQKPAYFSLDNHLVVGSALFRGRAVNDWNIQECVSDIVSKYLPSELPPWQITIIPSTGGQEERFYLLIRIHHLLLSEEGLCLGDLLLLGPEQPTIFKRRLDEDDENPRDEAPVSSSPLTGLFPTPVAIPRLYSSIRGFISKRWTQLAAAYDPAENPEILKSPPGIQICVILILITAVSITKELLALARRTDVSLYRKILRIRSTVVTEAGKRQCTPQQLCKGIINSLSPKQLILSCVSGSWQVSYILTVTLPVFVMSEIRFLVSRKRNYGISECIPETAFSQWGLVLAAIKELFCICAIVYTAPRMLVQELITSHRGAMHQLQTVSLCGRKVVAWSDPVPLEVIRKISLNVSASTTEILLSSVSGALREYFLQFRLPVPESVLTTARYMPLEGLMRSSRSADDSSGSPSGRGLLCLALPTSPLYDDPKESVLETQSILKKARQRQAAVYLASIWQLDGGHITRILPTLAVRLVLNHLSRRYAVALTQVSPEISGETRYRLIWGQEVEDAMYWRPPQSNISVSLTLMTYGDTVRLGVMSDSMIAPQHTNIVTGFLDQVYQLAAQTEVPLDRASFSHVYQPNIPPEGTTNAHGSHTSGSSASEELRRLASSYVDLNISTPSGNSGSDSPPSSCSSHPLNEDNAFPVID
ncbi:hypothetical protein B7P43_G16381 [Cryptotermes secundus]|uniref:O-acyltransferase WSD1 C-terminal domain-containing protein n=1 Tax=Cryptotermes secundus TaxID=105785 RepID=A0A2J7QWQ7_9NEOP|nr:uncharacterized protein LOC111864877 isoform X2 [Cryptotermes secundus]PNF33020.1 hypothetical protein B7P43_G16381 [Cryptotermes secundus]